MEGNGEKGEHFFNSQFILIAQFAMPKFWDRVSRLSLIRTIERYPHATSLNLNPEICINRITSWTGGFRETFGSVNI